MPESRYENSSEPLPLLDLEHFLPYRLSVLANIVSQAIAQGYQARFNLSVTEWRVLAVLGRYPGLSGLEVGERIAVDKVAVSRAVARLVEADRITRELEPADRRRSVLNLSEAGRLVYDEVAPMALAQEQRLLSVLSAEERAALDMILRKLAGDGVATMSVSASLL